MQTVDEFKAAMRLVYQAYLRRGYLSPRPSGLKLSLFHALPETATFVAVRQDGEVIGTVTAIPDSSLGLPMDDVYHAELDALRGAGHRLAEVSMLMFQGCPEPAGTFPLLTADKLQMSLRLFKAMFDHLRCQTTATELVACFNPKHDILYRFLHLEPLGALKSYPGANGSPAVARHLNIQETECLAPSCPVLEFFYREPLQAQPAAARLAFSFPDLEELFTRSSTLFASASATERRYLQSRYAFPTDALFGQPEALSLPRA